MTYRLFPFCQFLVPKSPNLGCFETVIQQTQHRYHGNRQMLNFYAILLQWDQVSFILQSLRKSLRLCVQRFVNLEKICY